MKDIRKILREYVLVENRLKKLGIPTKDIVGGYGEYLAAKKLKLVIEKNPNNKGYDAKDRNGYKYQIKARRTTNNKFSIVFPINKSNKYDFDYAVLISLDKKFDVNFIVKIPIKHLGNNSKFTLSQSTFKYLKKIKGVNIIKMENSVKEWYN